MSDMSFEKNKTKLWHTYAFIYLRNCQLMEEENLLCAFSKVELVKMDKNYKRIFIHYKKEFSDTS